MAFCSCCGVNVGDARVCPGCGARIEPAPDAELSTTDEPSAAESAGKEPPSEISEAQPADSEPDADAPIVPGYADAVLICLSKLFSWKGRASRSEYWYFQIFNLVLAFGAAAVLKTFFVDAFYSPECWSWKNAVDFAFFLLNLTVFTRRLHDVGKSGLNFFWIFLPGVGLLYLVVLLAWKPTPGPNKYGPEPRKRA